MPPQPESQSEVNFCGKLMEKQGIFPSTIPYLSPNSLAYIGDAVYELYVRTLYLLPPRKVSDYSHLVVEKVRAEAQNKYLQSIYPLLTETEIDWVRRGRNCVRKSPRGLSLRIYQEATALETLLGYLYICDQQRLYFLLSHLR